MARTRRSFGRVEKRASGRYRAAYVGPDDLLHRAPATFDAKDDAVAWLKSQRDKIQLGLWNPEAVAQAEEAKTQNRITLNALFDEYLSDGDLKRRTIDLYKYQWERLVSSTLGQKPVTAITSAHVAAWRRKLPAAPRQREQVEDLVRAVLNLAAEPDRRLIDVNPAARTRRKRRDSSTRAASSRVILLTPGEVVALADAMPAELRFAVLISAWCGVRQGEMFALRRSDLDLKRGDEGKITAATVRISRAVVRAVGDDGKRHSVETVPKSDRGVRSVAVPPHLLSDLDHHLENYATPGAAGLLFPGTDGGFLTPTMLYGVKPGVVRRAERKYETEGRGFYRARVEIGHDEFRWHWLRHHAVTRAAYAGAAPADMLERFGHSSTAISLHYQHAAASRDVELAERLSAMAGQGTQR